jgi:hypothetical protein
MLSANSEVEGWIGVELDHCGDIVRRLKNDSLEHHRNDDIVDERTGKAPVH